MRAHDLIWLALLLPACDGAPAELPDVPDAAVVADAGPALGRVDVSAVDFRDPSQPGAGLPVRFTDEHGAVLADVTTDAAGTATAMVPAGTTATIAWPGEAHLETIVDVAWGDHLHVGGAHRQKGWRVATMTVVLPAPPDSHVVTVSGPCPGDANDAARASDGTWQATIELRPGCAPYAVLAQAYSHEDPDGAYIVATDLAPSDGGTIALGGATWQPMPRMHARVAQPAVGATLFNVERVAGPARFSIVYDPTDHGAFDGMIDAPTVGPRADEIMSFWVGGHMVRVALAIPAALAEQTIDVAPLLIPSITQPSLDDARRTLTWTTSGAGHPDAISLELSYGTAEWRSWYVLAPPDVTSLALPPLPPSARALAPAAGESVNVDASADETDALDDYAAARNLPVGGVDALLNGEAWTRWVRATSGI